MININIVFITDEGSATTKVRLLSQQRTDRVLLPLLLLVVLLAALLQL